jgi:hypothetical protein
LKSLVAFPTPEAPAVSITEDALFGGAPPITEPAREEVPREIHRLRSLVEARSGLLYIVSLEEERVMEYLQGYVRSGQTHLKSIYHWSSIRGLGGYQTGAKPIANTESLHLALQFVRDTKADAGYLYVFADAHHGLDNDPALLRRLRDCAAHLRNSNNQLVLLGPAITPPADLANDVAVVDFPLPTSAELNRMLEKMRRGLTRNPTKEHWERKLSDEMRHQVLRGCQGMTDVQASLAVTRALIQAEGFRPAMMDTLNEAKRDAARLTECLEAVDDLAGADALGGLDNFKDWINKRSAFFTGAGADLGIRMPKAPKGVLLFGVWGSGKSLAAKVVAKSWSLPLFRLDIGACFGEYVGRSERNLRDALKMAVANAPVVLWIDEWEKMMGGGAGTERDGGTAQRVLATLLTFMQDNKAPVFIFGTANDVSRLDVAITRKGRLDELFFLDLPNEEERAQIFRIHISKVERDPAQFDLAHLVRITRGYVGAEIEQAVLDAEWDCYFESTRTHRVVPMRTAHIEAVVRRTVPMARRQRRELQALLRFVEDTGAVRASSRLPESLDDHFFAAQ